MINKVQQILSSTRLTGTLFIMFAAAMGLATFIENDFNTETSKALVYNTWWFSTIILIFVLNFIFNIKKYGLTRREKWNTLLLHLAFIFIIVGAAITRYHSFEGLMPIVEGESSSEILTQKKYLTVRVDDNVKIKKLEKPLLMAQLKRNPDEEIPFWLRLLNVLRGGNTFTMNGSFDDAPIVVNYKDYVPNAQVTFSEDKQGEPYLHLVESSTGDRVDHYLKAGDRVNFIDANVHFGEKKEGSISIYDKDGQLYIYSHRPLSYTVMSTQEFGYTEPYTEEPLALRALYTFGQSQFVVPDPILIGNRRYLSGDIEKYPLDLLTVHVEANGLDRELNVFGGQYVNSSPTFADFDELNIELRYGSRPKELPFAIRLNKFELERYPGSESPKSFKSKLTLLANNSEQDADVFMNNVLDFEGYRFFQSSYDDDSGVKQTILSVNHDALGTGITYLGYILLFVGLIWMLCSSHSYFGKQRKRLRRLQGMMVMVFAFLVPSAIYSAPDIDLRTADEVKNWTARIDVEHAKAFGRLVVQDPGGRMKPLNTFASELLRKLTKRDHLGSLTADQVLLSIFINPTSWEQVPMIYMKLSNTKVRDILGVDYSQKYARLTDFFDADKRYKLRDDVVRASKKKIKSKYDQSILDIDGRVGLLYLASQGELFKVIPIPQDYNQTWINLTQAEQRLITQPAIEELVKHVENYRASLLRSVDTEDFNLANTSLRLISRDQQTYGSEVIPSRRKIDLEMFYNKYDIFKNLFWQYMLASLLLFVLYIVYIFAKQGAVISWLLRGGHGVIGFLFLYHTVGLIIRWYISGHAPWSNGYESMIYVAWATMFFGLVIGRRSYLTVAATSFVASMILMVAHWNWMDPTIGNLVPVLNSYWLMIHVAIIVASYGPFAIGMILGMINLALYALRTTKNANKIDRVITELTIINELALTIGLVMLIIGNFLGGIWANESWGRYWGWDPKETWALVSIMIYAFVLHVRLIPKLKSKLTFNILSVLAFCSILMTYLGVNHLLSGLHSYAKGESAPIPNQIWGWLLIVTLLALTAVIKERFKRT